MHTELTIVIPYYKRKFLYFTLLSLLEQTNKNFKVFIGDDCSPDDPSTIINSFKKKLPITYHKFESNKGVKSLTQQWKRCIDKAPKSKWIIVLGDDDMLSHNCVHDFYLNIEDIINRKIRVVRFSSQIIDEANQKISVVHKHFQLENSIDFLFKKINGLARSSLSEYIFDRKSLDSVGFKDFPLAWHSDDLALLELSGFGQIFSINSSTAYIRSSRFNISGNKNLGKLKNISSFMFYKYLLERYQVYLSENRVTLLFSKLEKCVFNNRKNIYLLKDLSFFYLKEGYILRYLRFLIKLGSK